MAISQKAAGVASSRSVGRALDSGGTKVLAQVTLQVEVEWSSVQFLKGNYQTQQNQSASGVSNSSDTG